jgi:hypothetical protein
MRPDGSGLSSVALPKDCSPQGFIRSGDGLLCIDLSGEADLDHWRFAVERRGNEWRRAALPAEPAVPKWLNPPHDDVEADPPRWAPAGDRLAFIRPTDGAHWFSSSGKVAIADPDGSNERVVAEQGEIPTWSPDGKHLAFARCRVSEAGKLEDPLFGDRRTECSLWTVAIEEESAAELLAEDIASAPVWSPDGRFVAFLRQAGSCETFCRYRIYVVASTGGNAEEVGPELVEPSVDASGFWDWLGLAWLPESAPAVVTAKDERSGNEVELQRCVDVWNRARMTSRPTGAVNVSLVDGRCQITLRYYGGVCGQSEEMPFRFWCPGHGAGLHMLPPEHRVWNGHGDEEGSLSLFDPPKGARLPLPKAPPYPMLDGYVIPYGKDGKPLADLKLTAASGTCDQWLSKPDGYPKEHPDGFPERCWWGDDSGSYHCFKQPGRLEIGDTVLCPEAFWHEPYDPLRFVEVKLAKLL